MLIKYSASVLLAAGAISSAAYAQDLGIRPIPAPASQSLPITLAPTQGLPMAVPVAATVNPLASPLPIEQIWTLKAGVTIGQNLNTWSANTNWKVIWSLPKDWVVPNETSFTGDFADAAEKVIKTLSDNGVLVHIGIFEGNKTVVISGPGITQQ
ncbi:TcpQ domain-containing protein [Comamonas testosteroni]|jgi:hypothetical protein|uniref:TcpQ domain-containing protein n=1 Tax=Comamonas testosteroni TaxID=285 RepID=UPI0026E92080|nr:TcpQ domain-containing protein [Comamonas testosteroni]